MDVRELTSEDRWQDRRVSHAALRAARAIVKSADQKRLRCSDVARKRVTRYARRHRIPKPFWPLMATLILIGLIFERRAIPIPPSSHSPGKGDTKTDSPSEMTDASGDAHEPIVSCDTDGAARGQNVLNYRPQSRFLAKDVSQIVAYLIRNRGRMDNKAVRTKWDILDGISLPLAVYLREIEANAAWNDLEKEISTAPLGAPAVSSMDIPKSMRHRKILRLLPEWARRGEDMLSGDRSPNSDAKPVPTFDEDNDPDTGPRRP